MRPLELTVSGLRSYRTTTIITFPDDWRLAAVVGPTGAGKSSLLEAIVYALYGSGTVPGASQPINLITDGAREMRVTFRFAVGPESFEIARTYRRVGNVPPVLKSASRTYTTVKEVDEAVSRLLGLGQGAFCSTVLLPQGQFATLLQAAGNVQKDTLDAFFRLGEVTALSERLVSAANTLAAGRREVQTVRDQLPRDPAADVHQAQQRVEEAERQRAAADALAEVVARHETRANANAKLADAARRRASDLSSAAGDLDGIAARAASLEAIARDIASAEQTLAERMSATAEEMRAARAALGALDAPRVEATAAHVNTLRERIREASTAGDEATAAGAEAERERGEVERIGAEHAQRVVERDRARAAQEQSLAARSNAAERFERLQRLADEAGQTATAADAAERRRAAAAKDRDLARTAEDEVRQRLTAALATFTAAEAGAVAARSALAEAQAAAAAATSRTDHLEQLRNDGANLRATRDRLGKDHAGSQHRLDEARVIAASEAAAKSEADSRWQRAHAAAQAVHRENAAATAAMSCRPGDPCPVCARSLPEGFVPPALSSTAEDAESTARTAHEELASRHGAAEVADTMLAERVREEASAAEALAGAKAALAHAERRLADAGGSDWERIKAAADDARERLAVAQRAEQDASTALTEARADHGAIERNIQPLAAATRRAEETLTTATRERDDVAHASAGASSAFAEAGGDDGLRAAERSLAMATNALASTKELVDTADSATTESETRFVAAERRAATARATVDNKADRQRQAAGAVESAMALVATEARRGANEDPIATAETAERWVAARRARIVEAQRRQTDAEDAFAGTQRAAEGMRTRRGVEVEGPLAEATNNGTRLAILADIAPPTSSPGPAALAAWAVSAASAARSIAPDRQREAETADTEMVEARAAARAACEEAGVEPDQIEKRRADLQLEVGAAREARRQVLILAGRARTLDTALDATADRSRVLNRARDLCQGRDSFANHVLVARRQGLIAEAAAILTDLSSGRLTFAADAATTFSVGDTGSDAVRDPRLLSGGEQFQASLALALALVEIAARAGSRIECLFLDEGFAALDPASLETALDALESAARRGRRIVAVTHVDAVTARADQVLGVTGSDSGSQAAWRGVGSGVIA